MSKKIEENWLKDEGDDEEKLRRINTIMSFYNNTGGQGNTALKEMTEIANKLKERIAERILLGVFNERLDGDVQHTERDKAGEVESVSRDEQAYTDLRTIRYRDGRAESDV